MPHPSLAPAIALAAFLACAAGAGAAPVTRTVEGSFEEVSQAVQDAIVNAGLVIDATSHVGEMLARTKADVGGSKDIFTQADVYSFCSAVVSRKVMERDPLNLQLCPYGVFVYETPDAPGRIVVGHRDYAADGAPEVAKMLAPIIAEVAGD